MVAAGIDKLSFKTSCSIRTSALSKELETAFDPNLLIKSSRDTTLVGIFGLVDVTDDILTSLATICSLNAILLNFNNN